MKILEKVKFKLYEILKKYFDRDKIEKFPCFYINGSQTLPPPLNPLEEEETLRKFGKTHIVLTQSTSGDYWILSLE